MGGAVGLNDVAIGHAMETYFEVEKEHKLKLSLTVRKLASKILEFKRKNREEK